MAKRNLLPGGRGLGATFWLLAIMLFVMTVSAAAGLALFNGSRMLDDASGARLIVQLPDGAETSDQVAQLAAEQPGVARAVAVPAEEIEATLEQWLGPALEDSGLPLPGLVEIDLAPDADRDAIAAVITDAAPDARLSAQQAILSPMLDALRATALTGLGLVIAAALAAVSVVILATRAALAANRSTIAILHGMGATDTQVARNFEGRIARDALAGGILGFLLGGLLILLLGLQGGAGVDFLLGGNALIGPVDILILCLLPLVAAGLAFGVARRTILGDLRREP
ncbi:cell division protein FtsX [Sphingomicrobium sediminis]|uniref:Permease n=1 Tax=Sphingomicrobium sediminis TaxID=2950949 RepID=A0A9X2J486_9SPHN|nr:FtsX-like permease family protein [Sphingomicrobium sediminis]MCM8558101.1 permease [Sphingomicrobium sediminis]